MDRFDDNGPDGNAGDRRVHFGINNVIDPNPNNNNLVNGITDYQTSQVKLLLQFLAILISMGKN